MFCSKLKWTFLLTSICVLAVSRSSAQSPSVCTNLAFHNPPGTTASGLLIDLPSPGDIVENVVLPPDSVTGDYRPCSIAAPRYVISCALVGGLPQVVISFSDPIGPDQWVLVTLRSAGAVTSFPTPPRWQRQQNVYENASFEVAPRVVINEAYAGSPDWIEIMNLSPTSFVNLAGWQLEIRARGSATGTQVFTFDPAVLPSTLLPPLGRALIHDGLSSFGGAAQEYDVTVHTMAFAGSGSDNINLSCTNEGSIYLARPVAGPSLAPVDGIVFGYFREADSSVLHPTYPAPDTLQNYCENPSGSPSLHHSLYRMRDCLRFDPDAWHNRQLPEAIMGSGSGTTLTSPITLGDPNPGQCGGGGPPALVIGMSRCPSIVTIDGAEAGSTVYWLVSDALQPTQNSGGFIGLHLSDLLLTSLGLALSPPSVFQGIAGGGSACGAGSGSFEVFLGTLPPLCIEVSAFGQVSTASGPVLMQSNVLRMH